MSSFSANEFIEASENNINLFKKFNDFFNSIFRLKIIAFGYERISTEGEYIAISNQPRLAELFFETKAYKDPFYLIIDNKEQSNCGFVDSPSPLGLHYYDFRVQLKNQIGIDLSFYFCEKTKTHYDIYIWNFKLNKDYAKFNVELAKQVILIDYINNYELILECLKQFKKELFAKIENTKQIQLPNIHFFHTLPNGDKLNKFVHSPFLAEDEQFLLNTQLSPKEKETLDYYIQGMTAKEIGQQMSLSARTIECHITSIKYKLKANTRNDIFAKARKLNLLEKYR